MYTSVRLAVKYLQFYCGASNAKGHGVHSPFVYQFIREVLQNKQADAAFSQWKQWRRALQHSTEIITVHELGAGSHTGAAAVRSVGQIVSSASKPVRTAHLFYRIATFYQPTSILELGTSLGLTTGLFSLALPQATIHTIEGVASIHEKATQHFQNWGCKQIKAHLGNIDRLLPHVLQEMPTPDLVFMDGNHREAPTLRYFTQLVAVLPATALLIVDDIHWSAEMERAWLQIQQHPKVTATLDLFQFGIVLFRPDFHAKMHLRIRF
jgi:predicted O-methyltransferase YrrM